MFVGIQIFWVSVIWRGDIFGYVLEVIITDVLFVTFTYFLVKLIDNIFSKFRIADVIVYLLSGVIGLVIIEWMFAGNFPGKTEASQLTMFTTWGVPRYFREYLQINLMI